MLPLLFRDDDRDIAAAAAHLVGAATGAGQHPLVDHPVSHVRLGDPQGSGLQVVVVLRVGHGGAHGLGDEAGVRRGHEAQQGHRLVPALAANLVEDDTRFLGRDAGVAGEGPYFHARYILRTWLVWTDLPPWPRNVRVRANSPSLWPTMFSVMKMGTWWRPSCTAMVRPTISGRMVERRDQVRMTDFWPERTTCSTFFSSLGSA